MLQIAKSIAICNFLLYNLQYNKKNGFYLEQYRIFPNTTIFKKPKTKLLRLASYYKQLYIYFENEKSKRLLATFGNTRFFGSLRPSCLDFTFEKKYIIAEETKMTNNYKK